MKKNYCHHFNFILKCNQLRKLFHCNFNFSLITGSYLIKNHLNTKKARINNKIMFKEIIFFEKKNYYNSYNDTLF